MGAAMTGGCGGAASTGSRTLGADGAAADATAPGATGIEGGEADDATGFFGFGPETSTASDTGVVAFGADASEGGVDRASCCGDAGTADGGPCIDYSRFPAHEWSCLSYDPPAGCTCNIVVAIL